MQHTSWFTFCPHCAAALEPYTSDGVPRRKCPQCDWVHYRNPTLGVAVVLLEFGRLLVGERRDGDWCIPCGHVEWDESTEDAAVREMAEETGLEVSLEGVLAVKSNFHNPEKQTVGVWYHGRRTAGALRPGGDLLQVAFIDIQRLPPLKFPTDRDVVEHLRRSTSRP